MPASVRARIPNPNGLPVEVPTEPIFRLTVRQYHKMVRSGIIIDDDPVELLVNQSPLAKGEVVVADGHYAIRITQVDSPADRIRSLAN